MSVSLGNHFLMEEEGQEKKTAIRLQNPLIASFLRSKRESYLL